MFHSHMADHEEVDLARALDPKSHEAMKTRQS